MLPVTPAAGESAGLPGQLQLPEHGHGQNVHASRATASFSSSGSNESSESGDDEESAPHRAPANMNRRRVSLADEATHALQAQAAVEAAEDAEVVQDPGLIRKVCTTASRKRLQKAVRSRAFVLTVAFIITANAVYMGIEVDANDVDANPNADRSGWAAAEITFSVIFALELLLRFLGTIPVKRFFYSGWNMFDLSIVTVSVVDNILTLSLRNSDLGSFSVLRLLRLIRVIRVFRLLRVLGGLWKLVRGILNAAWTLFWTWILLAIVIYIFSIIATRLIGQAHRGEAFFDEYFGSMSRTMLTLFQTTTTEGWADIAREVMKHQPWTAGFFILYLHVTTFAILNVMIAVIVESTLDEADQSKLKSAEKRLEDLRKAYEKVYKVFLDGDADQDGVLTKEEFLEQIEQPKVSRYFEELGIDPNEAEYLFTILDYDGSGCLDASEFVGGLLKVIGSAKAKDIMAVHCELRRSLKEGRRQISALERSIDRRMELVETGVHGLRDEMRALASGIGISLRT
ncbi:unnamed protein product [Effrenium voratum]|uniref:EF-hand domain-containing protein n=1 Tax=Effrenium voratum TaxID=2562239 RepID=A0AA36JIH7_9DINO|nr:unnamed protein product [Effrenium voratum]CAJ1406227.1 unnamed protein product [Effrenium voratum]CAJ1438227.1 unnamed protein product [Effrenium voratum]|mmetsp:Transcript_93899/g.223397  ORF Transcript_93899/g.223397 Transcript_93899/m.223397 type:complete len:514 (+) Transcript_93899:74-1615(+)